MKLVECDICGLDEAPHDVITAKLPNHTDSDGYKVCKTCRTLKRVHVKANGHWSITKKAAQALLDKRMNLAAKVEHECTCLLLYIDGK